MKRLALFLLVGVTVGCGSSPTSPSIVNFQGVWQGQWTRQQCSETGGAVGVGCPLFPLLGSIRVTVQQDRSQANATIEHGNVQVQVSGTVSVGGVMTLTGQSNVGGATWAISGWQSTINGTNLSGTYSLTVIPDDLSLGTIRATNALSNVAKVG